MSIRAAPTGRGSSPAAVVSAATIPADCRSAGARSLYRGEVGGGGAVGRDRLALIDTQDKSKTVNCRSQESMDEDHGASCARERPGQGCLKAAVIRVTGFPCSAVWRDESAPQTPCCLDFADSVRP